jgi:hypothetical protein
MKSGLYIGSYITSCIFVSIPVALLVFRKLMLGNKMSENEAAPIMVLVFLGVFQFLIVGIIIYLVVLSKMWGSLQDGQTPISAGKAIGLLFIPVFNYYWLFRAWGGFPKEYQNYSNRYSLNLSKPSSFAFFAYPAFQIISVISFFAIFLGGRVISSDPKDALNSMIVFAVLWGLSVIIQTILFIIVIAQTGKALNNLKTVVLSRQANMPQPTANPTFQPQMNISR